jgi:hypothetical protein
MVQRLMTRLAVVVLLAPALAAAEKRATPDDPTSVILNAFRTHPIVALGEGQHWNVQGHAYRLSLIRDPRLPTVVNDIVVEFGDARYQHVMDRYVAGGDVPLDELRHVWEDTTMANTVFDMPIYEELFRTVRDVNRSLPAATRLRVLLGDPPIDWAKVSSGEQILDLMYERDAFAADLIRKEVLGKHRRALLLYADGHLFRKGEETVPDWMVVKRKPEEPLVSQLEKTHPGMIFNVGAPTNADLTRLQAEVANWRVPSIALLDGTTLGAAPFATVYDLNGPEFLNVRMQDQFDALLYLGPPSSMTRSELPRSRCADERYMKMRLARMALLPWGTYEIDALNAFCGRH